MIAKRVLLAGLICTLLVTAWPIHRLLQRMLGGLAPAPEVSGAYKVGRATLELAGPDAARELTLWWPLAPACGGGFSSPESALSSSGCTAQRESVRDAIGCAEAGALPAAAPDAWGLVLYQAAWKSSREDNARLAESLASQGLIVAALDDPALEGQPTQPFDMTTPERVEETVRYLTLRASAAAARAIATLNQLSLCLSGRSGWPGEVWSRVGFVGFSFGGTTALEAARQDRRIRAVVNLDGYVFTEPSHIEVPVLTLTSDFLAPRLRRPGKPHPRQAPDWPYNAQGFARSLEMADGGGASLTISGTLHDSFSDWAVRPDHVLTAKYARHALRLAPRAAHAAMTDLVAGFLHQQLGGAPDAFAIAAVEHGALLRQNTSSGPGAPWRAAAPMKPGAGSR